MGTFIVALSESEFLELKLLVSVGFFYKKKINLNLNITGLVVVNLELVEKWDWYKRFALELMSPELLVGVICWACYFKRMSAFLVD